MGISVTARNSRSHVSIARLSGRKTPANIAATPAIWSRGSVQTSRSRASEQRVTHSTEKRRRRATRRVSNSLGIRSIVWYHEYGFRHGDLLQISRRTSGAEVCARELSYSNRPQRLPFLAARYARK